MLCDHWPGLFSRLLVAYNLLYFVAAIHRAAKFHLINWALNMEKSIHMLL